VRLGPPGGAVGPGERDALAEERFHDVNNGVYKAGFATSQAAYEANVGLPDHRTR